jgi:hypothetical protein
MQRASVTVRLAGDLRNTVELAEVSPAEVLVLRHIHGNDAVVNVRPNGNDRGRSVDERGRLTERYRKHFSAVFPGSAPTLPDTFADIGVDVYADDDAPAEPKSTRKRKEKLDEKQPGVSTVSADDLSETEPAE